VKLDLCTPEASFSVHVPIMASSYTPLFQAILALAAFHLSDPERDKLRASHLDAVAKKLGSDIYSRHEEPVAARNLLCVAQILTLPMHQWRQALLETITNSNELGMNGFAGGVIGAGCWLLLRFGE